MRIQNAIILLGALALGGCTVSSGLYGNDEMDRYLQRIDTVTMSAGDAPQVNKATHIIHPWPPYVMDWRIPAQGTRAVRAVECYNKGGERRGPVTRSEGTISGAGGATTFSSTTRQESNC